jgi:hypothetical protein
LAELRQHASQIDYVLFGVVFNLREMKGLTSGTKELLALQAFTNAVQSFIALVAHVRINRF